MEKQAMNTKKKSLVFLVICCLCIIIVMGGVILYLLLYRDADVKSVEKTNQQESQLMTVNLTEKEAKELIGLVPLPIFGEWSDIAFLNQKVMVADMNAGHLMYNAMQRTNRGGYETCTPELFNKNGLCDFTFKVEDVKYSLEKLYGTSATLLDKVNGKFLWHCTRVDDIYVCSNSGGGFCTPGPIFEYLTDSFMTKYQKAEKDDNHLYVYVKFAHIGVDKPNATAADANGVSCAKDIKPEEATIHLYKYGTGDELIIQDALNGANYYKENDTKSLADKLYDQYGSQFTDYKLTYNSEGAHYSLVSVEPIK